MARVGNAWRLQDWQPSMLPGVPQHPISPDLAGFVEPRPGAESPHLEAFSQTCFGRLSADFGVGAECGEDGTGSREGDVDHLTGSQIHRSGRANLNTIRLVNLNPNLAQHTPGGVLHRSLEPVAHRVIGQDQPGAGLNLVKGPVDAVLSARLTGLPSTTTLTTRLGMPDLSRFTARSTRLRALLRYFDAFCTGLGTPALSDSEGVAEKRRELLTLLHSQQISPELIAGIDAELSGQVAGLRAAPPATVPAEGRQTVERHEEVAAFLENLEMDQIWAEATEAERLCLQGSIDAGDR